MTHVACEQQMYKFEIRAVAASVELKVLAKLC